MDGRPNPTNKAVFSDFSGEDWVTIIEKGVLKFQVTQNKRHEVYSCPSPTRC